MESRKKLISIISPCYNEEENIGELYERVINVLNQFPEYEFEYIFIDNSSTDRTIEKLKAIAKEDPRIKIIINTRNFGHLRSPYYGLLQTKGDASIYLASDLQDPPEMIKEFIENWKSGSQVVFAVKPISDGNWLVHKLRRLYYALLDKMSDVPMVRDATGFGLYDKCVLESIRKINDPYPYFRGLVCELGYSIKTIPFNQPRRLRGISKNNIYTLYDYAMLGFISHSLVPIRLASFMGIALGVLSSIGAISLLLLKIIFWEFIPVGFAPLGITMLFLFGLVLIFIGVIGEYVGSIHTYLQNRPVVVEKERINF